jgi:hypothetical protein
MNMRPYPEDAQPFSRFFAQRILNGFWKGWKIVRSIVVDEENLVFVLAQHLSHAIEAQRSAFM